MALSTPAGTYLLVGGINVTGDIYNMGVELENLVEETHTFGDSMEETTPVGIGRLTLSTGEGLYDDRLNGQLEAFRDAPTNATQLCMIMLSGDDPGQQATMLDGIYTVKYNRGPKKDGLTMATAEHVVNASKMVIGQVLHSLDSVTADGNTDATSVDVMFQTPAVDILASYVNDVITTRTQHGLKAGDFVFIAGHTGSTPSINSTAGTMGSEVATVPDEYSFKLTGVDITVAGTGGTAKRPNQLAISDCGNSNSVVVSFYQKHRLSVDDYLTFEGTTSDIDAAAPYDTGYKVKSVVSETAITLDDSGNNLVIANSSTALGRAVRIRQASAYADLHVPELTANYTLTAKIRHSDDDSTFANAGSFALTVTSDANAVVANQAQRLTISNLKRFRSMLWDVTGSGNCVAKVVAATEVRR